MGKLGGETKEGEEWERRSKEEEREREEERRRERQCKVEGELGGKEGINGGRKREQRKMEKEGGRIEEESKK